MATPPKQKPGKPGTNPKQTSPKVASDAAHVLNDPKATPDEKSAAASALAQARPNSTPKPTSKPKPTPKVTPTPKPAPKSSKKK